MIMGVLLIAVSWEMEEEAWYSGFKACWGQIASFESQLHCFLAVWLWASYPMISLHLSFLIYKIGTGMGMYLTG